MDFLTNTGAFIVVLGVMIFFHEFGHFITAKAFGMRVFVFSFGFGQRLLGFKWGDTDCRISLIPLGGYVKLEGEPDDMVSEDTSEQGDGKDFTARPRWQRILVYLAGPAMNVVLTVGVLTALNMVGRPVAAALYDRPIIGMVADGSPAQNAGLRPGDEILAVDEEPKSTWEDVLFAVGIRPEAEYTLRIRRDGAERAIPVRSEAVTKHQIGDIGVFPLVRIGEVAEGAPADEAGLRSDDAILAADGTPIKVFTDLIPLVHAAADRELKLTIWRDGETLSIDVVPRDEGSGPRIGVASKLIVKQFGFVAAVGDALRETVDMTRRTFDVLGRLVTAQLSPKTMMGPLGIAQASGDAARSGTVSLFSLIAMISLQIGILNLLPVPPLDGGHLAILAGESIIRRDFSLQVKAWIMNAGAAFVLLLIGLVLYSDLSKTSILGRFLP